MHLTFLIHNFITFATENIQIIWFKIGTVWTPIGTHKFFHFF